MKRLMKKYLKRTQKPLSHYRIFNKQSSIDKQIYVLMALFLVIALWFLLERLGVIETSYLSEFPSFVALLAVPTVAFPLLYINYKTAHSVVLAEAGFAKQTAFRNYKLYMYKDISKVRHTRRNVLKIKVKKQKVSIPLDDYEADLESLLKILKYEGHFKQPRKPYKIFFEGGEVDVQELSPSMNRTTAKLIEKFYDDYTFMTPGYLDDISLYNATLNRARSLDERHIVFELSHVDLKRKHPENTSFNAKQTDEAILIFQDVSHLEVFRLNKSADVQLLGTGFEGLKDTFKRGNIFEADFKPLGDRLTLDIIIEQGVKRQRLRFGFTDAILGFNKLEKDAWFENQA